MADSNAPFLGWYNAPHDTLTRPLTEDEGIHPELLDQLVKYQKKYPGSPFLLPTTQVDTTGWEEEDMRARIAEYKAAKHDMRGEDTAAFERLARVFETALQCIEIQVRDGALPTTIVTKESFYRQFGDAYDDADDGDDEWSPDDIDD